MKKALYTIMLSFAALPAMAQTILGGEASVSALSVDRQGNDMVVSMDIIPSDGKKWHVKSDRIITLTPVLSNDANEVKLPPIEIKGRNQYLYGERNKLNGGQNIYKASDISAIHYETRVPYEEWMDNSRLDMGEDLCGCCRTLLASNENPLKEIDRRPFEPHYVFITPKAETVKARSESGQAFLDFRVSKTDIDPVYRKNPSELQKINETIDLVRNDKDVTITSIVIKGYASPESPYSNNARLASGRVRSLADYLVGERGIDRSLIRMDSEPENWEGLREYVVNSTLRDKAGILEIIDSDREPDNKEWVLKSTYPEAYRELLADCYPGLRRTDYRIDYNVRAFDVEEAKDIMRTSPQKLSLNEMYAVAQTYPEGSDEYNNVFETAVRLYPEDPVANLNAALSALQRGDLVYAGKYLTKAGDSGEAALARGILAMLGGNTETAARLFHEAKEKGVVEADYHLAELERCTK